jgi:DNA invertase Pin-like site-specific DNA recombinase
MTAQRIGYRRVSTADQSTARQLDGLTLDRVFEDKASGATTDRPGLKACLEHLRPGDTLVVHSMDRLARSLADLERTVADLTARGVRVEFVKEGKTFAGGRDPMDTLMLQLLGAFAQFERAMIRERQREGIDKAKAAGVYRGGKPKLTPERVAELRRRDAEAGQRNRAQLARDFGISRETLYAYLRAKPEQPAAN